MKTQISSGVDRPAFFHQKKKTARVETCNPRDARLGAHTGSKFFQKWIVIYGGVHK